MKSHEWVTNAQAWAGIQEHESFFICPDMHDHRCSHVPVMTRDLGLITQRSQVQILPPLRITLLF